MRNISNARMRIEYQFHGCTLQTQKLDEPKYSDTCVRSKLPVKMKSRKICQLAELYKIKFFIQMLLDVGYDFADTPRITGGFFLLHDFPRRHGCYTQRTRMA